ncbi:MAG: amidase [Pseudomonadota bacterium]|nr:amidase [Pseudomonadota bacterium]
MSGDEIAALSLADVGEKIAKREISSLEATEAALDRIERYGEKLHVVVHCDQDAARASARKADEDLASGNVRGPMHGVPLAHKDMYYRAGWTAACGSNILDGFVPDVTSTAIQRLDAAGALDIARLHMVEFAFGPTGHNEVVGTPRNPWNTDYITGGSSSGSGASVAGRLVYGALGSDTGGSIRLPAQCCGLAGIKGTYGLVSRYGAMPLSYSLDHVGPLTRTVKDSALILQAIAGHDPNDPTTSYREVPDYLDGIGDGVKGMRIGVPENHCYDPVEDAVREPLEASLEVYRELGAEIVPLHAESIEAANRFANVVMATEAATYHSKWVRERPDDYGAQTLSRLLPGFYYSATRYIEGLNLRSKILADFCDSVFDKTDMLHAPVIPIEIPRIEEMDVGAKPGYMKSIASITHNTRAINFLGLPTLSVPCGFTPNGLPTGFQLIGRPFDEKTLFRAGHAYERETLWCEKAPEL